MPIIASVFALSCKFCLLICNLLVAISDGDEDTAKTLLMSIGRSMAFSTLRDDENRTTLHLACLSGSFQCCCHLILSAVRVWCLFC